jgi:phage terminase large subunit-like protein
MIKTHRRVQNPSLHIAEFTNNPPLEEELQGITNSKRNSVHIVSMLLFTELNINN